MKAPPDDKMRELVESVDPERVNLLVQRIQHTCASVDGVRTHEVGVAVATLLIGLSRESGLPLMAVTNLICSMWEFVVVDDHVPGPDAPLD